MAKVLVLIEKRCAKKLNLPVKLKIVTSIILSLRWCQLYELQNFDRKFV